MGAGEHRLQARSALDKLFAAGKVELAHYVVEDKHRVFARERFENFYLGKFYGQRRGARLTLRGVCFCVGAVDFYIYIVAVRAACRVAEADIAVVVV